MKHRVERTVSAVFAVAAVVVAALVLAAQWPARAESAVNSAHRHPSATTSANSPAEQAFLSDMDEVNARMHEAMAVAPSGDIDRDFMQMMIPHHQGAIDMALVMLKYGRDERLKRLAQSIIVEQAQEIAYMRSLLQAPPPAETTHRMTEE